MISRKWIAALVVLACWGGSGLRCALAQGHPTAAEPVQELQSAETTDSARSELLKLGKPDPEVRKYLAIQLPPLIANGPRGSACSGLGCRVWENAVKLAGDLKIEEAAPALARWINWRSLGPYGLSMEAALVFYPAATALVEIEDPAIPAVQDALDRGNPDEHYRAVRILCIIHSPSAKAVLRGGLQHVADPDVQVIIKRVLGEK